MQTHGQVPAPSLFDALIHSYTEAQLLEKAAAVTQTMQSLALRPAGRPTPAGAGPIWPPAQQETAAAEGCLGGGGEACQCPPL